MASAPRVRQDGRVILREIDRSNQTHAATALSSHQADGGELRSHGGCVESVPVAWSWEVMREFRLGLGPRPRAQKTRSTADGCTSAPKARP